MKTLPATIFRVFFLKKTIKEAQSLSNSESEKITKRQKKHQNMEKIKSIINELNKIFNNDYNCFSFNNLSEQQLLQIVLDLMYHLTILEEKSKHESLHTAALEILNKLEAIKYTPEEPIQPEAFRTELLQGNREVIYPILDFLLKHPDSAVKRYYLSKYATKVEVPSEILLHDKNLQLLEKRYAILIEEFWNTYAINKKEKGNALQTVELKDDICQMKIDKDNLNKRLNQQKEKLEYLDIQERKLQVIQVLCQETKRNEKMQLQLDNEISFLEGLKELSRFYQRRDDVKNLGDFLDNVENNRNTTTMLNHVLTELEINLELLKNVSEANEPNHEDIFSLHSTYNHLQHAVNRLKRQTDVTLEASLNQLKVFEKKNNVLSKQIVKIQARNDCVVGKIEQICSLLGGNVLSGKSLKEYVAQLRQTSLIYKDLKKKINSMDLERKNLARTLEILYESHPDLTVKLKEELAFLNNLEIEATYITEFELKNKINNAFNELTNAKQAYYHINDSYKKLARIYKESLHNYNKKKCEFQEVAGEIGVDIEKIECDYERLTEIVALELEDLNRYVEEAEDYKECLLRYSQYIIENTGDISYLETVEHKLKVIADKRQELMKGIEAKNSKLVEQRNQVDALNGLKDMILVKLKSKLDLDE